jgi:CHAT domain-containing protein
VAVTTCPRTPPSREAAPLSARAAAAARARADAGALQAAAAVDLMWSDGRAPIDQAIGYLQTASRLSSRPASVLSDLSAAHLLRAERAQSPRDLLAAVEAADRALEADPGHLSARWNLALALDRLGVDGEAMQAWSVYLARDSASEWAGEARERIRAIRRSHAAPPRPDTSAAALEAYGERAPQEAGWRGWVDELGAWGAAIQRGDTAGATPHLRRAEALGRGIARRPGGDAGLSDAVAALHAHAADPAALRALAAAHADYAEGRRIYLQGDYPRARGLLGKAAAAEAASGQLRSWAGLFHAATLVYARDTAAGGRVMRETVSRTDANRYPALAGRAHWMLGTTLMRADRPEQGLAELSTAERLFQRAGERENVGTLQCLEGQAAFILGDPATGYEQMHRALLNLRLYPGSPWLHNQLQLASSAVGSAGLGHAALRLQTESLRAAREGGIPLYVAEAVLARAQMLVGVGRGDEAARDVAEGRRLVGALPPGDARTWLESDLRTAQARLLAAGEPARAAAVLDTVLRSPAVANYPQRELVARLSRAEARLRIGRADSAARDLDRVIEVLDRERTSVATASLRASLIDAARPVFDRMIMLQVAAGRSSEALRYLERGREAFAPVPAAHTSAERPFRAASGETALEYALIGDTLLTWVVRDTLARLTRATLSRDSLLKAAERVRSLLELRAEESTVEADLALLYDRLVRPVERALGPDDAPVAIIADGEIAGIPFAALRDRARGRYLVEAHPLRFTPSLADVDGVPERTAPARSLVVADPRLDPRDRDFPPLPGARAEADSVRARYPSADLLAGAAASAEAISRALPQAGLLHFAGHAVFDDERPERSFLLVAPDGARPGRLTAADVEQMRLPHLRLVVLSACETLPSLQRRSGGFAGFSAAFLAAGAHGVVGSMWRVDDRSTAPLMVEFHRVYTRSGDGVAALRTAQLHLLRSTNPDLRSPSAWAAFRYAGHP